MGTTVDKLAKLAETKEAIRTAIESKGVEVSASEPFSTYPEKIKSIQSGGVGRSLLNINVTLDGAINAITKGSIISITNNATGEVVERVWEGEMIQITVESLSEYTIKCSKITGYSSPKKVTFTPANSVSYNYTFDYITPPVGVYLLTTDDELILPANWKSSYECAGVYVGFSQASSLAYSKYVLAPEIVPITTLRLTKTSYSDIRTGADDLAENEYGLGNVIGSYNFHGLSNTQYIVNNYSGAFAEAWNYPFKTGARGFVPSLLELRDVIALHGEQIVEAYAAIGVEFPYSVSYTDSNVWSVSIFQSSTPSRSAVRDSLYLYGWGYGSEDFQISSNDDTTIPFSVY